MSKIISRELKIETLLLYRNILKLHYFKLNEEMRLFGDYFVKSEFTMNYKQGDQHQIKLFNKTWKDYYLNLQKMKDINKEITSDGIEGIKTKMDIDQRKSLDDIKNIINDK